MKKGPYQSQVYENPELEAIEDCIKKGMYLYARMRIEKLRGQLNKLEKKIEKAEQKQS